MGRGGGQSSPRSVGRAAHEAHAPPQQHNCDRTANRPRSRCTGSRRSGADGVLPLRDGPFGPSASRNFPSGGARTTEDPCGPLATRPARRNTACDCRPRCLDAAQTRHRSSRRTAASQAARATAARHERRKESGARWTAAARRCSAAGELHPTLHLASTPSKPPTLASGARVQHRVTHESRSPTAPTWRSATGRGRR